MRLFRFIYWSLALLVLCIIIWMHCSCTGTQQVWLEIWSEPDFGQISVKGLDCGTSWAKIRYNSSSQAANESILWIHQPNSHVVCCTVTVDLLFVPVRFEHRPRRRGRGHVPPKFKKKYFSGNYYVKSGHFFGGGGKNHVKFGNFVIFWGKYHKNSGILIISRARIM